MVVSGEQAFDYLSVPDVMQGKRPGDDPLCDEAVATLCNEYRETGSVPPLLEGSPARRACGVLLVYAGKYLAEAGMGRPGMLDMGLLALEVGGAAVHDEREAGRLLDRYILLVGNVRAETPLLSTAARLDVSAKLKGLIRRRLAEMA